MVCRRLPPAHLGLLTGFLILCSWLFLDFIDAPEGSGLGYGDGVDILYTGSLHPSWVYSIDGSSVMLLLIFSKIVVFQLSSFMTWSYSTIALVKAAWSFASIASVRKPKNLHSRVDGNVVSWEE